MRESNLLVLSAFALAFNAGPVEAQYFKRCYEPSEPYVPSGYYEEKYEMESAEADVENYASEIEEYQSCLKRNSEEATSSLESIIGQWNNAVQNFNSR